MLTLNDIILTLSGMGQKRNIGLNAVAKSVRDSRKRLKGLGLPVELCVKLEQYAGVKPGEKPDFIQRMKISDFVIQQLTKATEDIHLTAENMMLVKREISQNHKTRTAGQPKSKLQARA